MPAGTVVGGDLSRGVMKDPPHRSNGRAQGERQRPAAAGGGAARGPDMPGPGRVREAGWCQWIQMRPAGGSGAPLALRHEDGVCEDAGGGLPADFRCR